MGSNKRRRGSIHARRPTRRCPEEGLGVRMSQLAAAAIIVGAMLVQAGYSLEFKQHNDTKEGVYKKSCGAFGSKALIRLTVRG